MLGCFDLNRCQISFPFWSWGACAGGATAERIIGNSEVVVVVNRVLILTDRQSRHRPYVPISSALASTCPSIELSSSLLTAPGFASSLVSNA